MDARGSSSSGRPTGSYRAAGESPFFVPRPHKLGDALRAAVIVRLSRAGVNWVLATTAGESAYNRVHKRKQHRSGETHKQYSQHHGN